LHYAKIVFKVAPQNIWRWMVVNIFKVSELTHVYCSTIHNSQVMETAKMLHYWRLLRHLKN